MEKDFDSRALLKSLGTYAPKKKQHSKAMQRLLATDPLDLDLEDHLNAVLDEIGVDLWGPRYDRSIEKLQGVYLIERLGFLPSEFDFGQPCGASHISDAYVCRIGAGSGLDYKRAQTTEQVAALEAKYAAFEQSISGYSPEAQQHFRDMVKKSVDELGAKDQRTELSDEKATGYYDRILTNAKILADDGPPTKIFNKSGEEVAMSDKIYPVLSRTGNMSWKDPVAGMSYTKHGKGEMELEQNRPSLAENLADGRVAASVRRYAEFKKSPELQAKGGFGSPGMAKLREVSQEEIDTRWSKLTPAEREKVSWSGVDSVGNRRGPGGTIDHRAEHRAFYERNPDLLAARGKEVLAAYLQQTPGPGQPARSAFTNEEIPLPGLFGPGGKAVVDHYVPLSSAYPKQNTRPWSREEGMAILISRDSRNNMVIVEGGLNNSKGKREDWAGQIIPGWSKESAKFDKTMLKVEKMPSFMSGAKGPAPAPAKTRTAAASKKPEDKKRVTAQKADQKAARAATKAQQEARKVEKQLEANKKAVEKARAERNKFKPGTAAYKRRHAKVEELATKERRYKREQGLL